MLSPGADLGKEYTVARAEVTYYHEKYTANALTVWYMGNSGKWVQVADTQKTQNGKTLYVNNTCVVVCAA